MYGTFVLKNAYYTTTMYNVGFEVIMPLQQVECSGIEQTSI